MVWQEKNSHTMKGCESLGLQTALYKTATHETRSCQTAKPPRWQVSSFIWNSKLQRQGTSAPIEASHNDTQKTNQIKRLWRVLCCGCEFCGGEARREARLVRRVKSSIGPAIQLEEAMAEAGDRGAQVNQWIPLLNLKH